MFPRLNRRIMYESSKHLGEHVYKLSLHCFVRDGVNPDTNKVSHVTIQITNKHDMFRHMLVTGNIWDRKYNKNRLGVS